MDNCDSLAEVGLAFTADWDKPGGFIGREASLAQKRAGVAALSSRLVQVCDETEGCLKGMPTVEELPLPLSGARRRPRAPPLPRGSGVPGWRGSRRRTIRKLWSHARRRGRLEYGSCSGQWRGCDSAVGGLRDVGNRHSWPEVPRCRVTATNV